MSVDLFETGQGPGGQRPPRWRAKSTLGVIALVMVAVMATSVFVIGRNYLVSHQEKSTANNRTVSFVDISLALSRHDRERFLAYAGPGAKAAMGRWFDNQQVIGYTVGGIVVGGTERPVVEWLPETPTTSVEILAGTVKTGAAEYRLADGKTAGVPVLTPYRVSIEKLPGDESQWRFVDWKPIMTTPWDDMDLVSRTRDNVTLVTQRGRESEIEEYLPDAVEAAAYVKRNLRTTETDTVTGAQNRSFLAFLAPSVEEYKGALKLEGQKCQFCRIVEESVGKAMHTWGNGIDLALEGTPEAGLAYSTGRASSLVAFLSPLSRLAGALPPGRSLHNFVADVLVHEWTHVVMQTLNDGGTTGSTCAVEGFARFVEKGHSMGVDIQQVPYTAFPLTPDLPAREGRTIDVYGDQASEWYLQCASIFGFLNSQGVDASKAAAAVYRGVSTELGRTDTELDDAAIFANVPGLSSTDRESLAASWARWRRGGTP